MANKAWVGPVDGSRPGEVFDTVEAAETHLNDVIAMDDPEGVESGDYYIDVETDEAEDDWASYGARTEPWLGAANNA